VSDEIDADNPNSQAGNVTVLAGINQARARRRVLREAVKHDIRGLMRARSMKAYLQMTTQFTLGVLFLLALWLVTPVRAGTSQLTIRLATSASRGRQRRLKIA
jgi:hypothetical protein